MGTRIRRGGGGGAAEPRGRRRGRGDGADGPSTRDRGHGRRDHAAAAALPDDTGQRSPTWGTGRRGLGATAAGAVTLAAYLPTVAPTVGGSDCGELTAAAWHAGIAHPPGFPLYVLVGWVATHVATWGSVAVRLNLLSAVAGAIGVCLVARLLARSLEADDRPRESPRPEVLGALAALLYGFSPLAWRWATVAEVYTLHQALGAAVLLAILAWRRHGLDNRLVLAAALGGLALGNHVLLTLTLLPPILAWILRELPPRRLLGTPEGRRLLARIAGAGTLPGVALYAFLLVRSTAEPAIDWGHPATLERLLWHVTGRQYQVNLFGPTWASIVAETRYGAALLLETVTVPGLLLAMLGVRAMARRARGELLPWLVFLGVGLALPVIYDIEDDQDAYYFSALLAIAVFVAWGLREIGVVAARWGLRSAPRLVVGVAVLLVAVLFPYGRGFGDRSSYRAHEAYAQDALDAAPEGALLLTGDWQLYAPLIYFTRVEGARPDVLPVDIHLFQNRPWYIEQLRARRPEWFASVAAPLDAFLERLRRFERGTLPPGDTEIGRRYQELWTRWLAALEVDGRPIVATPDVFPHLVSFGVRLPGVAVPVGVVYELRGARAPRRPDPAAWSVDRVEATPLDEPAVKVRRHYAQMAAARALAMVGPDRDERHLDRARALAREAVRLDPRLADLAALRPLLAETR